MLRWGVFISLLVLVAPSRSAASLPTKEPGWHILGAWRQPDGLPQNTVYTVLQTRDGYLWIGTKGGVSRFDGVGFTTWDNGNREHLRENEVWALVEGDDGSLWIGTFGGGVSRFKNGRFTVFTTANGLVNDYVTSLAKGRDGAIWIGTDGGLGRFKDGQLTRYGVDDGLVAAVVRGLYVDEDDTLWIGHLEGRVTRFRDGRFEAPAWRGGPLAGEVRSFWRGGDGGLWITSQGGGLARLHDDALTVYTTRDGLSSNRTRQVRGDARGDLWIVSDRGLDRMRWRDGRPSLKRELQAVDLGCVTPDREGSLWVGSAIEGLLRLHRGFFASYSVADGLGDYYVASILEDRDGRLWVGTRGGLSRAEGNRLPIHETPGGLGRNFVGVLAQDRQGRLWAGTDTGLYRAPAASDRFVRVGDDPVARLWTRVLLEDRDGAMWVGTDHQGLARCENDRCVLFTTADGLPSNAIRALAQDRAGRLWIATRGGGLVRREDGRFTTLTVADGLAGDGVHALYIDADDTLWIGTRQGLNRLKDGRFRTCTARDGLFSDFVYSFLEDEQGRLWMGSSKGVFHVRKSELNDFADGRLSSVTSTPYGLEHGLTCTVAVVASHPAGFRTSDGRLWFGTANGLSVVDPRDLKTTAVPPPVPIESVAIDRQPYDPRLPIEAPPGNGDVEIRYTGLSFLAPDKVRFRYRLEPYDDDWIDAGTRRVAYYTNLKPGTYRFRVKASNSEGVWNEAGTAAELRLAPHFRQTPWFYLLCSLGGAAVGLWILKRRDRDARVRETELATAIDERTRALKQEITERTKAEEALRRSEERYSLAVRGANDGVWDWDIQKDRVYFSPRWKAILGYAEDEIGDDPREWLGRVHPDEVSRVKDGIAVHCEGGSPNFEDEHRIRHRDGSYRWVLTRGFAVRGPDGRPSRMIGVQTDVTDRRSYDPLTGLPNRALFVEWLGRALLRTRRQSGYLIGVLFLDLDRFKVVNDSLGHLAGDRLLITMAQVLQSCVRPADMIARFGGDEFAVLLDDMHDVNDAVHVAERIQRQMQGMFDIEGAEIFSSVSIGIATSATGYESADDLLRDADTAMYRAKASGRARYEVFDAAMRAQVMEQLEVESELRRAVERSELVVHYQPLVCLRTGALLGFEALVRWPHPRRGLVYPESFISVAEETGLIVPLGYWVLREACRQMRLWHDEFPRATPPTISANVSARQFLDETLVTRIREILDETRLDPQHLHLEITESVIMKAGGRGMAMLAELKAFGVRLHLDDFGTGYSSLSYLHQFPVDALKIDRSFVSKLGTANDSRALILTILTMAANLEIAAVAEGVETLEQLTQLRAMGCDQAQGFYFAEALAPPAAAALLATHDCWTLPEPPAETLG